MTETSEPTDDLSGHDDDRPNEHGGGEAGPPIAGDPSSFPSDAELARTLLAQQHRATLSTLAEGGYPYGSLVSYAADADGAPVMLISDMAEHTVNAKQDSRASLMVSASTVDQADPLSQARCTLVGQLTVIDDPVDVRSIYLERHPYASYYVDFTDFSFWRLTVERCRYVGGFGHMSWVGAPAYDEASVDPIVDSADGIVEHMNADHSEANLLYAQVLADLPDAESAAMVGIDRYGVTLQTTVNQSSRLARVPFPTPLDAADQAQAAVIELLQHARELAGQ